MLAYTKVLKQNGNFRFELMPIPRTSDLKTVIKSFFDDHESGVHTAIVCTDNPNEVMDEEDFRTALSRDDAWSVDIILADGARLADADCVCARRGPFEFIGQALADILKCANQITDKYDNSDNSLISALFTFEERGELPLRDLWSYSIAKDSSAILNSDQSIVSHQTVPDIRILLLLPQKHFETFSNPECYFPEFLEYVVLGENGIAIWGENQELKEKIRQLEVKNNQLAKEKQAYIGAQTIIEQFIQMQGEFYEKGNELLKILQKINTQDRFGERPEAGIDSRTMGYQQNLETELAKKEGTPIKKENRGQTALGGYETQTIKLPEHGEEHTGEEDKQLDIRIDRKEFKDRSDNLSGIGRQL